jgi:hypothetical protein
LTDTFYTLIANAHREGINAKVYLTEVFTRLPDETNQTVLQLTPKAWAAARRAKKAAASALMRATVS